MLAGEPPFTGPTAQAIIARRLTEPARPIRPIRGTVPQELEDVAMGALAGFPADRPASAGAFAERLGEVGRGRSDARPALRSRPRRKWIVGAAAGVLAAALIGTLLRSRAAGTEELDASLLAVAPFDVLDSKLGLWREGMVDLLSRNLDGAGPLRTVSPTVVVRRWSGRADPGSAGDLARGTGAGLAIYGSLLGTGRDSVRLRATLFDVEHGSVVDEWDLRDGADQVDRLTDSLTIRILQALGRTRPSAACAWPAWARPISPPSRPSFRASSSTGAPTGIRPWVTMSALFDSTAPFPWRFGGPPPSWGGPAPGTTRSALPTPSEPAP